MELPQYLQIEPVGQCNLRCRMCPVQFREVRPAFMAFDTFTHLVDQFPRLTRLHLQGLGEPLLHPRFFEMVDYAVRRRVEVTTNTNLTMLTPAKAQACVTSGLAALHASLDGASATVYEHIRVGARFDKVLRNLRRLLAVRAGSGQGLPRVELVMVLMRDNLHELEPLVQLAHDLGVDGVFVQRLCHDFAEESLPARYRTMRAFVDTQALDDPRLADALGQALNRARALAASLDVPLRLPRPVQSESCGCDWPWRGAYLSFDGVAMPCCMVATPDRISFGNMQRDGAAQVWNNAEYNRFRARLASDTPPDICRSCALYHGAF